jgi:DNA-binding transcriptional regulator YhcF (GntR family)
MPLERTEKIEQVKSRMLARLRNGFYQPGDRFLSNRAASELFGISYQTAHRLIAELCHEGLLERRPQSGTYVPGASRALIGAQLVFHRRAAQSGSFGSKLLAQLTRRLDADRIDWSLALIEPQAEPVTLAADRLPVIWESPATVAVCAAHERTAVLINERPRMGLESMFIDSIATDDFSGGACAAQLLRTRTAAKRGFAIIAGPQDDPRNQQRVNGFLSVQSAAIVSANSWFFDAGFKVAEEAVRRATTGLFCCNDQLASAVIEWCQRKGARCPPLVGFDDAPVAERLNFTTIAIPWEELVEGVARILKRRLAGDRSASSQQIFNPRPVIRD